MNVDLRRTLLALAVMAAWGVSHASAQSTESNASNAQQRGASAPSIDRVDPNVPSNASANAVSQANQSLSGNTENNTNDSHDAANSVTHSASVTGNVADGASGNLGMNQAAGDANAQSNQAAIATSNSSSDTDNVARAKTVAAQSSAGLTARTEGAIVTASINGNAFRDASGNVGVNQAADGANEQLNQLSIASAPGAMHATAASSLSQASSNDAITNTWADMSSPGSSSKATLTDDAFAGANGNIGVNQASGLGNIQSNSLAVSASSNAANNARSVSDIDAHGNGELASFAHAQARQASTGNGETDDEGSSNSAVINGNFGYGVSGNAGVNQSSGDFNLQGNQATIAALSSASNTGNVTANANIDALQSNLSSAIANHGTVITANINGNALQNASGNVGVNQAAGSGNEQLNQLSIATAPNSTRAEASSSLNQASSNYSVNNGLAVYPMGALSQGRDAASLADDAFAGATGNLGVNQSVGFGNLQHNSLAVSVASNAQNASSGTRDVAADGNGASAAAARSQGNQASSGESETLYAITAGSTNINGNFGYGVSGNVGVNQSSGDFNLQSNQAAIAVSSATSGNDGSAHAKTIATQSSTSNTAQNQGTPLPASIGDNAFRDASGNLGLNQASGSGNQQLNQLSIATARNAAGVVATSSLDQALRGNSVDNEGVEICSFFGCDVFSPSNTATLTGDAMTGANGNVGVNQASGLGNAQSNSLAAAVSTTSDDHAGGSPEAGVDTDGARAQATQISPGTATANTANVNPNDLSSLGGNVGYNASGNVGVNQASGNANAQGNQVAISVASNAADDAAFAFGSAAHAETVAVQSNTSNSSTNDGPTGQATITDNAFRNASGNVGINQVAGDDNKQLNQVSIAEVQNAAYATATVSLDQEASNNTVSNNAGTVNTAQLSGNAFVNASGNISVNQAAGDQNMQTNSLSLAVSSR